MRHRMLVTQFLAALLLLTSAAIAQEDRHEISVQGTGFFTKDSQETGISQHSTDTGGLLVGYAITSIAGWQPMRATGTFETPCKTSPSPGLSMFSPTFIR